MNDSQAMIAAKWKPLHGVVVIGLMAAATLLPALRTWPLFWLVTLFGYAVLVTLTPPLRATFRPWRFGRVSRASMAATAVLAIGSSGVLIAFHRVAHPDVSAYGRFLPISALGGVIAAGILFSVFNALFEELIFRGILFDAVESQSGVPAAICATAFLFDFAHKHGYPPGLVGGILAGIYGICLGWLRVITGGLGLPILAHIGADATIFTLLARSGTF